MGQDMLSIVLGFLEGLALILSPCILPMLPIVMAVSLTSHKRRPLGVSTGFIVFFALVAFFSRQLVVYAHVDLNIVRTAAYLILFSLGIVMLSSRLTLHWEQSLRQLQQITLPACPDSGFWSGFLLGGVIAIVWVPCAGPILAAVIVQTVIQKATVLSFFILLAFSIGIAVPMLLIALYGQSMIHQFAFLKNKLVWIRKGLGFLIIGSVLWALGQGYSQNQFILNPSDKTANALKQGLFNPYLAPPISGITNWINSPPLTLAALRGHVVLLDFWTCSCINCLRTIPHLNALFAQYHVAGLDIIGVHAPEFAFENDASRVAKAVQRYQIHYPVALDNYFSTWTAFGNHYWPAQYLVDREGRVVYEHFGEGNEDILENNIRYLLHLKSNRTPSTHVEVRAQTVISPEIYLGYERSSRSLRPVGYQPHHKISYQFPRELPLNHWALSGGWHILRDHVVATEANNRLKMHFKARQVHLVMGSEKKQPVTIHVLFNGKPHHSVTIAEHALYPLLTFDQVEDGEFEIEVLSSDLAIYTITFSG